MANCGVCPQSGLGLRPQSHSLIQTLGCATGATAGLGLDSLFHGNAAFGLGAKSDIADGSLRGFEFRKCAPEHSGFSLCTLVLNYLCCDPALCDFLAPADRRLCRREVQGQILTGCVASCRYDNLYGDYYISPQFLEAITVSG